jgi:hypothetical protein
MPNPSTTTVLPDRRDPAQPPARRRWQEWLLQRDRLWLLLILLILAALSLGGCHARSDGCHASSCGGGGGNGAAVAVFWAAYILVVIITSAAGG